MRRFLPRRQMGPVDGRWWMRVKLALVGALCIGVVALVGGYLVSRGGDGVSASELLAQAASAKITLASGSVLHLRTKIISRTKPADLRLQDPYHLDRYAAEPEVAIADAWFEADAAGNVSRRYTVVTDAQGRLIQEESRTSDAEELIYNVADNIVERIPAPAGGFDGRPLQTIDSPATPPGATSRLAGRGNVAGIDTSIVEVDSAPAVFTTSEVAYERPYVRDLNPSTVRELFNIGPNGDVLSHSIDLVEGSNSVRVSERTVLTFETIQSKDLAPDFFEIKRAAGAPRLQEPSTSAASGGFLATSLDDQRLAGKRLTLLPNPERYGLSFSGVFGAASRMVPPAGAGDARFADEYGLATTAEYQGNPGGSDGPPPTLRIVVGNRSDLLPLLQSALPFWSRSSQVAVTPSGAPAEAWLMESVGETAVILDRGGTITMWDAQAIPVSSLLEMASASTEVTQ